MTADLSVNSNIPSMMMETSEIIILQSTNGKGFGLELDGNAKEGFIINKVSEEQCNLTSGQIHSGDMVSGIGIDLDNLNKDDLQNILSILSPYPIKVKIKKPMIDTEIALKKPKFDSQVHDSKFEADIKEGWIDEHKSKIGFGGKSGTFDVNVPDIVSKNISADVNIPSFNNPKSAVNIDAKIPETGKKSAFHIKFPKFGSKGKTNKSKSVDVKLASTNVDMTLPTVELDGDAKSPKAKAGFHINLPKFGSKGKGDIKNPNLNTGLNIEGQDINIDLNKPNIGLSFEKPEFSNVKDKAELHDLKVNANLPDLNVKGQLPDFKIKADIPDLNVTGEFPDLKLNSELANINFKGDLPDINIKAPGINVTQSDINIGNVATDIKVPKLNVNSTSKKSEFKVDLPNVEMPTLNITAPDIELKGQIIDKPELKIPTLIKPTLNVEPNIQINAPDVNVNLGSANIDAGKAIFDKSSINTNSSFKGGEVDISDIIMHIEDQDKVINLPKFGENHTKPEINIESPDINVITDIKQPKGGTHFNLPSLSSKVKGEIKSQEIQLTASGKKPKTKMHFGFPKFGSKGKADKMKLKSPKIDVNGGDIYIPELSGQNLNIDIEKPKGVINLNIPKASAQDKIDVNLHKTGEMLPNIEGPSGGFHVKLPTFATNEKNSFIAPKIDINLPKINTNGNVNIDLPSLDMKGTNLDIKDPDISFNATKPDSKLKPNKLDFKENTGIDIKAPDVQLKIEKPIGDFHINLPNFGLDKDRLNTELKAPDENIGAAIDINLNKSKQGLNFEMPSLNMKVEPPKVDLNVALSNAEVDVDKPKDNFHISLPSFGLKTNGVTKDINADINVPKLHVDASTPSINLSEIKGDVTLPEVGFNSGEIKVNIDTPDVNLSSPKGKIDMPEIGENLRKPKGGFHINMPKFGSKGKGELKIKSPDIKVEAPNVNIDMVTPNLDFNQPDANLKVKKPVGGFHIGLPKFGMKGKGIANISPDLQADLNLKSHQLDINIDRPNTDINIDLPKIDIEAPKYDLMGKIPELELKGGQVELNTNVDNNKPKSGFHVSLPKFGSKGKGDVKIKSPKIKIDASAPTVDISGPKLNANLPDLNMNAETRNVDLNINKSKGNFNINMPKFDLHLPKFGEKAKNSNTDIDLNGPNIDINTADNIDVNINKPKSGFHINMPKLDVNMPKFDVNMPKFGGKGKIDDEMDVNLKTPELDINIEAPKVDVNIEKPKGGFHVNMPKFDIHMPKLGGKGKIDGGADVDLKAPELDINAEVPEDDVNIGKPKGGFHVNMPKFDLHIPKFGGKGKIDDGANIDLKTPELDINAEVPEVDVNIEKPKGGFHVNMPKFDVHMPKFGGNGKIDGGTNVDIKTPEFGINAETPEIDVNIEKPKGSFHVNMPKFDIHMPKFGSKGKMNNGADVDIKTPELDINEEAPEIDVSIEKPKDGFHVNMPKFDLHMAKFGGKGKIDGEANVDIKTPEFDINPEVPDVNIEEPKGGFHVNVPKFDVNIPKFDVHMPKFGGKGKMDGEADVDIKTTELDINTEAPEVDVNIEKPKGGFHVKIPKLDINIPKFGEKRKKYRLRLCVDPTALRSWIVH